MFKEQIIKFFLESTIREDEDTLDFGPIGPDKVIDEPIQAERPKLVSSFNFLGQPVKSKLVANELINYMKNIRKMLKRQYISSLTEKVGPKSSLAKYMRDFLRNVVYNKRRVSSVGPNVDLELISKNRPERFIAFLQEYLYVNYLRLLQSRSDTASIEWSSERIDIRDEKYVKELLGGKFWDNIKNQLFLMPDIKEIFDLFKQLDESEINRRSKEKERSAARIKVSPKPEIVSEINKEVVDKFKKQYGDKTGEKIYYATANKQGRSPETFRTKK